MQSGSWKKIQCHRDVLEATALGNWIWSLEGDRSTKYLGSPGNMARVYCLWQGGAEGLETKPKDAGAL